MPPSRRSRNSRTKPSSVRIGQRQIKFDEQWNARFKELLSYRSEHGDCNVPKKHGKLGRWVATQRAAYMANSIAQDRVVRLDSVGFKWALVVKGPITPWETRFKELVQYKAKHGDCDVPRSHNLGRWVKHQRTLYMTNTLAQDRVDRLDSIGFKWRKRDPEVPWETRFEELVQYKAKHGDCDVPKKHGKLGIWVATQRAAYMANSTSQDRVDRLDSIGFKWKKKDIEKNAKGKGRNATTVMSLKVPSKRSNHGTESDVDEVDEIGALIYNQVMQRR